MRVERACHTLHNDHGPLKQDKLRPRFHAEPFRDLEKVGQQAGHRDTGGIHAKDRLPHGAQGAGEFIHILVGGDVSGLEMHLGHAKVIAPDEAIEDLRIDAARILIDMAHDSEIIGDDVAFG